VRAARAAAGSDKVVLRDRPMSASEDFACFSQAVPSCYVFVGIKEGGENVLHHNSRFQWRHERMLPLAAFFAAAALDYLS